MLYLNPGGHIADCHRIGRIGEDWLHDLDQLRKLEAFAHDTEFQQHWRYVKHTAKCRLGDLIEQRVGIRVDSASLFDASWPQGDQEIAKEDEITLVVQVNGKVRDRLMVAAGTPDDELERLALAARRVQPHLEGKSVRKVVVVPNKLVNIVVG